MHKLLIVTNNKKDVQDVYSYISSIADCELKNKSLNLIEVHQNNISVVITHQGHMNGNLRTQRINQYIYFGSDTEFENQVLKPLLARGFGFKEGEGNDTDILGKMP